MRESLIRKILLSIQTALLVLLAVYIVMQAAISYPDPPRYYSWPPPMSSVYYETPNPDAFLNADDLWRYKLVLRKLKTDKEYIEYDAVKTIGWFTEFVYLSNWYDGEYGSYYYCFDNRKLILSIDPETTEFSESYYSEIQLQNLADLRFCEVTEPVYFLLEDIHYMYKEGKIDQIIWKSENAWFSLDFTNNLDLQEIKPGGNTFVGKLLNGEMAKKAVKQLNRYVQFVIALRKSQAIRLVVQWSLAVIYLIWGILQLLNLPVELWKKTASTLDNETVRKKYRRGCGVVKILLAAVVDCMAFIELFEPLFMLAFALMYGVLLLLALAQQLLLNREYTIGEDKVL